MAAETKTLKYRGRQFKYRPVAQLSRVLRFLDKILDFPSPGCWEWAGSHDRRGYGQFWYSLPGRLPDTRPAHRFAYWLFVGDLVPKHNIHHVCCNPTCVNPRHLLQLSLEDHGRVDNFKTHCARGHLFTDVTTGWGRRPDGRKRRFCLVCFRAAQKRHNGKYARAVPLKDRQFCPRGHRYDEANTYMYRGIRHCRTCHRESTLRYERRQKGEQWAVDEKIPRRGPRDRTKCPAGHPYDKENTYIYQGRRHCRECQRERNRKYQRRKEAERKGVQLTEEELNAPPKRSPYEPGKLNRTHCRKGHELTEANVYWFRDKWTCRTCRREYKREYKARKRAERQAETEGETAVAS